MVIQPQAVRVEVEVEVAVLQELLGKRIVDQVVVVVALEIATWVMEEAA
jgi:hypothetical protein